jgi:phosphatidylserine decarboxylase
MSSAPIEFFNRYTGHVEREAVYGEAPLRFAYENPVGRLALELFVKRRLFSRWYGWRMDQAASKARVLPFIEKYGLAAEDFADAPESFATFNEFFYRKLKPTARPIDPASDAVIFPADGRHLGFPDVSQIDGIFVKGQKFSIQDLVGDPRLAERFAQGTLVLSRLCPVDYHRFHFPADGVPGKLRLLDGLLYSVNPIALRRRVAYLWENKRTLTLLETEKLGTVILMEIGATNVGSIKQTYAENQLTLKGAEKGFFEFGGSSTILLFEPGRIQLAADLQRESAQQRELYARMGDRLGTVC